MQIHILRILSLHHLSEDILRKLAEDEAWIIREDIAGRPDCPEDVLRKLAEDETERVRKVARAKLKC